MSDVVIKIVPAVTQIVAAPTRQTQIVTARTGGNVNGPAGATNNAIAAFNGTSGKILESTPGTIDPTTGNIVTPGTVTASRFIATGAFASLTSDTLLTASDSGRKFNNRGASGPVIATLPASSTIAPGWEIELCVVDAFLLQAFCVGSDVIVHGGLSTGAPGYAQSSAKGALLRIVYQGSGEFFAFVADGGPVDFGP